MLVLLSIFLKVKAPPDAGKRLRLIKKVESMDPMGCLLFIATVCCFVLALQWGGQSKPWTSPSVLGLLVGSLCLASLFGYTQWKRQEQALIPLRILCQRPIITSAMVLFFLGASTYLVYIS